MNLFSLQLQSLAIADNPVRPNTKPVKAIEARIKSDRRRTEELRKATVAYIRKNGPVAGCKVAQALGFSTSHGALWHLRILAERGIIKQTGARKGSKWEIVK